LALFCVSCHPEYLRHLGADQVIDYNVTRFEDVVRDVDLVFDAVGGDTLDRSYTVVRRGGTLVSVARPTSSEQAAAHGIRATFFIVEPDGAVLERIGRLIDDGVMRAEVDTVLPLSRAYEAYERSINKHGQGKVVLQVAA
jgi:NADPH:quinone reductase-like Zn-dependent oxidoreductase